MTAFIHSCLHKAELCIHRFLSAMLKSPGERSSCFIVDHPLGFLQYQHHNIKTWGCLGNPNKKWNPYKLLSIWKHSHLVSNMLCNAVLMNLCIQHTLLTVLIKYL